ncbi:MAG: tyrosine-type recombinase/integrase [Leptospirales bacterium]|nr:tyrosine-type recombinase/integrase [Leptospirales bacterium]
MGIKINNNQDHLEKGFVRYDFYFKNNGIQHRKTIKCRKSAVEAHFLEWQNKILNSTNKSANKYKLFEILDEYLEYCKEVKTDRQYTQEKTVIDELVKKFFDPTKLLNDVKRSDIDSFKLWRKQFTLSKYKKAEKVSNATVNRNLAGISYFFNWCIKKEYYERLNPCYLQKLRDNNYREVMLTSNQLQEIFDVASKIDNRFLQIISILLLTGMRKGELFSLEWSEVNFDTRTITLSRFKTKSRKMRIIPISPELKELLLSMKNNKNYNLVVGDYTVNILKKQWDKLLTKISCPVINDNTKLRVHDLRHIFAQSLLNANVGLEDIQSLLGHQDITTTQKRYANQARPDLIEKVSRIDNVINIRKIG